MVALTIRSLNRNMSWPSSTYSPHHNICWELARSFRICGASIRMDLVIWPTRPRKDHRMRNVQGVVQTFLSAKGYRQADGLEQHVKFKNVHFHQKNCKFWTTPYGLMGYLYWLLKPNMQIYTNLCSSSYRYLIVMMQKPLKIRPPCHILPDYFITGPSFKNLNVAFLNKWTYIHF